MNAAPNNLPHPENSPAKERRSKQGPFCWQSKAVRRAIRDRFDVTNNVATALSLYDAMTEAASDKQAETFTTTHAWLQMLSGVSPSTIKKHLKVFADMGIVSVKECPGLRGPSTYTLLANGCLTLANGTRAGALATSEESQKKKEECVGAEPPPPAHTQHPPWFQEIASKHPTKDAEACWPGYLEDCVKKQKTPSAYGLNRWLTMERVHLRRAASSAATPPEDAPHGWQKWLADRMPSEDHDAFSQLRSALGVRRFSAMPESWQQRCRNDLSNSEA